MSTTIESLQVEVQSSASSAVSGIDALASSLGKLKSAVKGGVGLTAVAKQLTTLKNALNGISGANADYLNKLAQGLQTLSSCGKLKLSSSVSTQITNIGTAVRSLNGTDFSSLSRLATALIPLPNIGKANLNSFISQLQRLPQALQALSSVNMGVLGTQIGQLVSALAPLSQMGKNNLTSFVTQLQKLPQVMNALRSIDMGTLASQVQQLANALAPLATQMQSIANGFAAFPARIQRLIRSTNSLTTSNNRAAVSYANLATKIGIAYVVLTRIARVMGSWINESNKYVENLNLFTVAMGKYANKAQAYAQQVAEILGIDPADWIRNQGIFNTIIKGFGVAGEKAQLMSKNLTQLGYDISSFYNVSINDAMAKLSSGIAGELEPLRRLGYDLSVARLQQEAYTLGIKKSVNQMTQAEKSQLRYYAIMTQVTDAHGDMARTLHAPANQLRILQAQLTQCARALGNIFIPVLNAVLPYAIAVTKVIRILADTIAKLIGFSYPEIDYSGLEMGTGTVEDLENAFEETNEKAKKLKKTIMGFDELNILNGKDDYTSDKLDGLGGEFNIPLPEYDFLGDAISGKVDEIMKKLEPFIEWFKNNINEILAGVMAIGAAFLAWKIAKDLIKALAWFSTLKGLSSLFSVGFTIAGLGLFLDGWNTMKEAIQDILENGPNFTNVTKLISGFAEGLGAAFLLFGNVKLAGVSLIISGIAGIVSNISDIVSNGINWENATSLTKNIGLFVAGIGLVFGNLQLGGIGLIISGVSLIIQNFHALITGFTTGDWSDVNWIEVASGALMLIGGLIIAFKTVNKIADVATIGKTTETIQTVTDTTSTLDTTISTGLSPKLTSLAKNLGMGILIIGEIAIAAGLITSAIWGLGLLLEQVGTAWQPVIDNGGTVAAAMGLGTGILAAIGAATALLGSVGTSLIANLALGIAMLALIGVSAGLFIAEIWAIGKGLDEIGQAWDSVMTNGETIATAIGLGTALLVTIGVASAALGMATVATAGLLPLAIGLGTAILLELGVAAGLFIIEVWAIGKGLDEIGKAWQPVLDNGETIATGIGLGTALLIGIGVVTAALGVATVASVGLLPLAIALGTAILVELAAAFVLFTESLIAVANELANRLSPALRNLNGKLPMLSNDMRNFVNFMTEFAGHVVAYTKVSAISGLSATVDTIIGWFTKDPIEKLAEDVEKVYNQFFELNKKLKLAVPELKMAVILLTDYRNFLSKIEKLTNSNVSLSNGMFVNMKEVGTKLITGFVAGIESKAALFSNAAKQLVKGFESELNFSNALNFVSKTISSWASNFGRNMYSWGSDMMRNMVAGINSGLRSLASKVASAAATIRSYLHFSQPDVGPLSDFNSWMPDMMSQLAGGIADNEAQVKKQINKLASDMSLESSIQANVSAYGVQTTTNTTGEGYSGLINAIYNAVSSAIAAGQNDDTESGTPIIINLGNEQIASFLIKQNKRVALISGGKA